MGKLESYFHISRAFSYVVCEKIEHFESFFLILVRNIGFWELDRKFLKYQELLEVLEAFTNSVTTRVTNMITATVKSGVTARVTTTVTAKL